MGGAETETWEVESDRGKAPVRHGKSRRGGEQRGRGRQDGQQRPCRAGGRQKEEKKRQGGREMDPGQTPSETEGGESSSSWRGLLHARPVWSSQAPLAPLLYQRCQSMAW